MADEVKRREISLKADFSRDPILVMLVNELVNWLRMAEDAEAALAALRQEPLDADLRSAFEEALRAVVSYPTDWIAMHAAEKKPKADVLTKMGEVKKLFQRVDFLLMPDPTVTPEQSASAVKARLRAQTEKVGEALTRLAGTILGMAGN